MLRLDAAWCTNGARNYLWTAVDTAVAPLCSRLVLARHGGLPRAACAAESPMAWKRQLGKRKRELGRLAVRGLSPYTLAHVLASQYMEPSIRHADALVIPRGQCSHTRTCMMEGFLPDDSHIDEGSFPYCLHAYRIGTLLASPCANGYSNVDQVAPCALGHSLHSMPAGSRAVYMLSSCGSLQSVEPCERAYISPTASRGSFLFGSNPAA